MIKHICSVCKNQIYDPDYYEIELCPSCATGESDLANPLECDGYDKDGLDRMEDLPNE